jgi:hypothetical protein
MAKFVADNYAITINGTNFSTSLASVELSIEADDVETTAFGGSGYRTRVGGLKAANISLEFHQDFAAAALDSVLFPLLNTLATVVIIPAGTTVGASNPSYACTALVTQYNPYSSAVGDLATVSVSWPVSGTVTRATA